MRINLRCCDVAGPLHARIAAIVSTSINHCLADLIHLSRCHLPQARDSDQSGPRHWHRKITHKIKFLLILQSVNHRLCRPFKLETPNLHHGARAEAWKNLLALGLMRRAVFAHHILAHQTGH